MMYSDFDRAMMRHALQLAEKALYLSSPNPRVGCVLTQAEDIIGEGYTQIAGKNHAEIQALNDACAQGHRTLGATAYVTLEPCSHIGRTPPCTDSLINAGVTRVVAAMQDPNPLICGAGFDALRNAGITVQCGLLEDEATALNLGFIQRIVHSRPWVRLKMAVSLDGKTALNNGQSQWITSAAARHDNQHWRARSCAILSGIGTVRADNPLLNVRDIQTPRQPLKVIVDSTLKISAQAQLLQSGQNLIVSAHIPAAHADKQAQLQARGIETIQLPRSNNATVDLPALMQVLAQRGINELHVEAGSHLNGALLEARCVDELLIYMAPTILGPGRDMFHITPLTSLSARYDFKLHDIQKIGQEARLQLRLVTTG